MGVGDPPQMAGNVWQELAREAWAQADRRIQINLRDVLQFSSPVRNSLIQKRLIRLTNIRRSALLQTRDNLPASAARLNVCSCRAGTLCLSTPHTRTD
jgi:hypothetical protein